MPTHVAVVSPSSHSLIATLSRDLRQEFYPFFPDIFVCLQRLLANAGPDAVLIENIFACLSYLFKFLQKQVRYQTLTLTVNPTLTTPTAHCGLT